MSTPLAKSTTVVLFLFLAIWILLPDQVQLIMQPILQSIGFIPATHGTAQVTTPLEEIQAHHTMFTYALYAFVPVILYFIGVTAKVWYQFDKVISNEVEIDMPLGISLLVLLTGYALNSVKLHTVQQLSTGLSDLAQYSPKFSTLTVVSGFIVFIMYVVVSTFVHAGEDDSTTRYRGQYKFRGVARAILLTIFAHLCQAPTLLTMTLLVHAFAITYSVQFAKMNKELYLQHRSGSYIISNFLLTTIAGVSACLQGSIYGSFKAVYLGTYGDGYKLFKVLFPSANGTHFVPHIQDTTISYVANKTYLLDALTLGYSGWLPALALIVCVGGFAKLLCILDA